MYELIYTSLPKGLLPGRSGFATAAMTEGMPPNLIVPLENLSGYNFTLRNNIFDPGLNPPCCYYIKMRYGNQLLQIAGRVAPNGLDYSQRNNKIAHHLLFETNEESATLPCGVAGLFLQNGVFCNEYSREPALLPFRKVPECANCGHLPAANWSTLAGHAGFAAYTAERFIKSPETPLYLIYPQWISCNKLLELVMEVCALLPQRLRNHFTFSTYFGNSSASVDCFLRMLPDFSPLVSNIRRFHTADTIELGKPNELPTMEHYPAIYEYACTGNIPQSDLYNTEITEPEPPSMHTLEETLYLADNASPESTDIPAIEIPPPVSCNKNYSKFVFAAAAAILVIGITILLLYDIPGKMAVPSKEKRNTNNRRKILQQPGNIAPSVPITPSVKTAKVPAVAPSASKSSQAHTANAACVKTVKPPEKQPVTETKTMLKNPEILNNAAKLPEKAAFDLYLRFTILVNSCRFSEKLSLPETLHGVEEIYPVIQRIGTSRINSSEFTTPGQKPMEICIRSAESGSLPLRPSTGDIADTPHISITITPDKSALLTSQYTGSRSDCILPELKNLKKLYFRIKNKVYVWENKLYPEYCKFIPPGKIVITSAGHTRYIPNHTEKILTNQLRVKIGGYSPATLSANSFFFDRWNKSAGHYQELLGSIKKLEEQISQQAQSQKHPRSADEIKRKMEDLQKLAKSGDIQTTSKEFFIFLNQFFNAEEKPVIAAGNLLKLADKMEKLLSQKQLNLREHQLIKVKYNTWLRKIRQIEVFQKLQNTLAEKQKEFTTATCNLQNTAGILRQHARYIHPDIEVLLLKLLYKENKEPGKLFPAAINSQHIGILAKAIAGKVRFEPVPAEMEQ